MKMNTQKSKFCFLYSVPQDIKDKGQGWTMYRRKSELKYKLKLSNFNSDTIVQTDF